MKRVALYARVSTDGQTVENQVRELREVADRLGWEIVAELLDEGISGSKGRSGRPSFDRLLKGVARREFDLIAAWSVDRLGRSLQDLVSFLGDINSRGVDLYLHQQGVDTSTPSGRAMFQMLGVFSEFERAINRGPGSGRTTTGEAIREAVGATAIAAIHHRGDPCGAERRRRHSQGG